MQQPTYFERNKTQVCKLRKALYGLKQSPRLWYKHISEKLRKFGFISIPYDEGAFINIISQIILLIHVDDIAATGPIDDKIYETMQQIQNDQIKL